MKLREVIEKIDLSNNNNTWVDFEEIAEELNIGWEDRESIDWNKNEKIRSEYITCHICTDTWVGIEAYFLDGELICITNQEARKSPKTVVGWASQEMAEKTKDYVMSLRRIEEEQEEIFEIIDLEQEMGESFQVNYSGELLHKNVIHENELCKVIQQPYRDSKGEYNFYEVIINKEGIEQIVDIRDIKIPFMIDGKFNKYNLQ